MANPPSDAERFRVEHNGQSVGTELDWNAAHPGYRLCSINDDFIVARSKPEATFRLLLYTDPRQALKPFLEHDSRGGIIDYVGTCGECGGSGCPKGTPFIGGPAHGKPANIDSTKYQYYDMPVPNNYHYLMPEPDLHSRRPTWDRVTYERRTYRDDKGNSADFFVAQGMSDHDADKEICRVWPCPACHGTGGPPAQHLIAGAADWYEERGYEMEASVLRGMITKGSDNGN